VSADVETIVIGAGVVGLAVGRACAMAGQDVMVIEQHDMIGVETSSRNSEVIHAGIYYPPGSLRAKLCVAGKRALYAFCAESGVSHRRCGKLLVATAEDQLPKLDAIRKTAIASGVNDLVPLSRQEAQALEPEVNCAAALLSPSTGIIDSHGLMLALEGHIEAHGGQVVLRTRVERIDQLGNGLFRLTLADGEAITCQRLVMSAGLHASSLAAQMSLMRPYCVPPTYYAKGQYYALSGRSPFSRHVYPMPQGAWLGLHATIDIGGRCKFGPDIQWIDGIDYKFEPERLEAFLAFIRSYYPGLDPQRLHPDYVGVRPKLYRDGEPVADFRIDGPAEHGVTHLVMLYGIESPGLTAALAIGDMVAGML
jgi:L-2-hydroxyglutarate oxidase LhgO